MKKHKKIFNFRFFVLLCLAIIILIVFSFYVCLSAVSKFIFAGSLFVAFVILLILFFIFKKKTLLIFAFVLMIGTLPILNLALRQNFSKQNAKFDNKEVLIQGRICDNYTYTSSGNVRITVDEIVLIDSKETKEINGKIYIYVRPQHLEIYNFKVGCFVECLATTHFFDYNGEDISRLSSGVVGYSYCNYYNLELKQGRKLKINEKIKDDVYQKLTNWNVKFADVGYAMLFGDSSVIDTETRDLFRNTGVAHILAVSGLHISILIGVCLFILRKLKCKNYLSFMILAVVLGFYSFLCDFSVSVVRACLMGLIAIFVSARGKPYDRFSVLSFVASLILIVSPAKLFNVSFILSFTSVLSIILLISPIKRLISKLFNDKFADLLALTLSVQVMLIPIQLFFFGNYPLLSLLSNILTVPLESIALALLFVFMPICLVFPFLSFTVKSFGLITEFVVSINRLISKLGLILNFSQINWCCILLIFAAVFMLSDFVFVKKRWKALGSATMILISLIIELSIVF